MTIAGVAVEGTVATGFERVADALAAEADELLPGGAAFAVYLDGVQVVDLWLGNARPGQSWQADTPSVLMSATKGVTALAAQICASRDLLDPDAPVALYWPEFAAGGKSDVLVRHVLAHTSGVTTIPGYAEFLLPDGTGWEDEAQILDRIAQAEPTWAPGTRTGYHGFTYGWIVGELVRRVTGRPLPAFIRDEIAEPLDLSLWLGTPPEIRPQVAHVIAPPRPTEAEPELLAVEKYMTDPANPIAAMLLSSRASNLVAEIERFVNDGRALTLAIPASTGVATARSLAAMYQLLACGGELNGTRLVSEEAVRRFGEPQVSGTDEFFGTPGHWGLGYQLSGCLGFTFAPTGAGFGHWGHGGQFGWADPTVRLSAGFLRTRLGDNAVAERLGQAVYAAIDG